MSEREELEFDPIEERGEEAADAATQVEQEPPPSRRVPGPMLWGVLAMLVLLFAVFLYLRFGRPAEAPEETASPVAEEPAPDEALEVPEPVVEVPPLDDSDAWLREVVAQLSSHPRLTSWLVTDDLVRRFTASVDNLAEGVSPGNHLPALRPSEGFPVVRREGRLYMDPEGYHRYDTLAAVIDSLHVEGSVDLYRTMEPLVDEAYRELGYPDRDFDRTLARAIEELLAVPVVEGQIEVEAGVSSYEYADPALEGLSQGQKHLLRMGPDNVRRIQAKLRQLAAAADLPVHAGV